MSKVKASGGAGSTVGVPAVNGDVDDGRVIETTVGVQVAPVGFAVAQAVVVA